MLAFVGLWLGVAINMFIHFFKVIVYDHVYDYDYVDHLL